MFWSRRLPSMVVTVGLAGSLVAACNPATEPDPDDVVTVFMESTGPGSLEATDPDDGTVVSCSGSATCGFDFQDVGGGGTLTVAAVPDAGAMLQSWTQGCPGSTAPTCDLSFSHTPATLSSAATFVAVPPSARMFSDAFAAGCGNWTASTSGTAPGSSSEVCPGGTGGSDGGDYRQMTHTLSGNGTRAVVHTYTPGSLLVGDGVGEFCAATVTFQEYRRVISSTNAGAAVGAAVWIEQNSMRYNGPSSTFTDIAWRSYNSGALTAADFTPGLDLCPGTASTLTFGYIRSNAHTGTGGTVVNVHGIDEWSVTFAPAP